MPIVINQLNIRTYSRLGQAGTLFGVGLFEAIESVGPTYVLTADMGKPAGLSRFMTKYPDYYINVGIAEQNLIGVSAGIAAEGHPVIASAQAVFLSMRCYEQVRQFMGYMNLPIVLVGVSAGFALTFFGNTHYAIEDIAIMRAIPNLTILSPADPGQAAKSVIAALESKKPTYIRCTGKLNTQPVYEADYEFSIGKAIEAKLGRDVAIFATGTVTANAIAAALLLEKNGVSTAVIDMHTIKPLDTNVIGKYLDCKLLVTVEEHSIIGGLAGAISEYLASLLAHPPLIRLGIKDCFVSPGDYPYLISQNRLDAEGIATDVMAALG